MATKSYDPKKVRVIIDGTDLTGVAEGTFVKIAKNEDNFTAYVGAQGEVSYAETNDNTGMITVTLSQTSPQYKFMNAKAAQKNPFPCSVIDRNTGGVTFGGAECRIMKVADAEYGKEIGAREFNIHVANLKVE